MQLSCLWAKCCCNSHTHTHTHTHTDTHTYACMQTYIYVHIHSQIHICTIHIKCGIRHEKSQIATSNQVKSTSYELHKISKNMTNHKENSSKQPYASQHSKTSLIRMFICIHRYDQQIESCQWMMMLCWLTQAD